MAFLQQPFDSYLIYSRSGPDGVGPWTGGYRVMVNCFKANTYVGGMRFVADSVPLPANSGTASSIELHYPLSRFNDIVTILRYEKPLHLSLYTDSLVGMLSTTSEPIGEQEPA